MEIQGAGTEPGGKLPWAGEKCADTSGDVEAKRKNVLRKVGIVGQDEEVAHGIGGNADAGKQHEPPEPMRES